MNEQSGVFIALGANLGDPRAALTEALDGLAQLQGVTLVNTSSNMINRPVDCPPGSPDYFNAVCEIRTTLSPRELMNALLELEASMGRLRSGTRNESRTIDLDIIFFGDAVIDEDGLTVPHPRMHLRDFVLVPLAEIAPDVMHPTLQRSIKKLLDALA